MKLPKNYFENLSTTKYREYLKLLPDMKKESTRIITMLIFTFIALSILGIFAINPTLTTIVTLQKQLEDSTFVYNELTTKMQNLSKLQQQYAQLTNDLPIVLEAIPQTASVPTLMGQLQALAKKSNLTIIAVQTSPLILSDPRLPEGIKTHYSFTFSLEATGSYEAIMQFISSLSSFNRIVTLESISLSKDSETDALIVSVTGREYYKK